LQRIGKLRTINYLIQAVNFIRNICLLFCPQIHLNKNRSRCDVQVAWLKSCTITITTTLHSSR
jgi:hypothetical protein